MRQVLALLLVLFLLGSTRAQEPFWYPDNLRFSNEADIGIYPCMDTMKVYGFKHVVDLSPMLPSWRPVVNHDTVVVLEGQIMPIKGQLGYEFGVPHVSYEDLPLYHYTHDFSFNVFPDSVYRNLLSRYIKITKDSIGKEKRDTIVRGWVHCEWESGLGAGNRGNKYSPVCRKGGSAGFATAGHERGDIIWNWPTAGDWVHVEGLWIWDRGHPPARTEIHPIRFLATRRNLPDKIVSVKGDSVFATRIDLYANGDGGAFYNNRDTNIWVKPVKMSNKDYQFKVKHTLPRPAPNSVLEYLLIDQKGNSYDAKIRVEPDKDSYHYVNIVLPWKSANLADTTLLAKTLYLYWNEGIGIPEDYRINTFHINLNKIKIRRLSEVFFLTPAELRMFAEVGGQYVFLNEHVTNKKEILRAGFGKTIKRNWKINKSFIIYVPEDRKFRVYVGGWEADGVDKVMGRIVDQDSDCTSPLKKQINNLMLDPTPVGYGGCEDDNMGESINYHQGNSITEPTLFEAIGDGKSYKENCPLGERTPIDFYRLEYSITPN